MKIINQSVPAEFAARMASYMQMTDATTGTTGYARKNSGLPASTVSRRARRHPTDFEKAAEFIATDQRRRRNTETWATIYDHVLRDLKSAIFNTRYWETLEVDPSVILSNQPTSVPRILNKPYAYRDPTNLPSVPTYSAGTPSDFPLVSRGSTKSGYYSDDFLSWALYTARVSDEQSMENFVPVFWKITSDIYSSASTRGSRPMLSAITKVQRCLVGEPPTYDTTPPTTAPRYINVRYQPNPASPPFWHGEGQIQAVITAAEALRNATSNMFDIITLKLAPAPMFGKYFNNNTWMETEMEPNVEAFAYKYEGWKTFANNLQLYGNAPYRDCGTPWNPCNGFFSDNAESSTTMAIKFFSSVIGIRSLATGHTEAGNVRFVPAYEIQYEEPPEPPAPPYEYDPLRTTNNLVFVGSAGTCLILRLGVPPAHYNPESHAPLLIRVQAGGDPNWWPHVGGIQVLFAS